MYYKDSIGLLKYQYIKPINQVFARYCLATWFQEVGKLIDEYFGALKILNKDCNFLAVTVAQYCVKSIMDHL